jgi:hypothetical protein
VCHERMVKSESVLVSSLESFGTYEKSLRAERK